MYYIILIISLTINSLNSSNLSSAERRQEGVLEKIFSFLPSSDVDKLVVCCKGFNAELFDLEGGFLGCDDERGLSPCGPLDYYAGVVSEVRFDSDWLGNVAKLGLSCSMVEELAGKGASRNGSIFVAYPKNVMAQILNFLPSSDVYKTFILSQDCNRNDVKVSYMHYRFGGNLYLVSIGRNKFESFLPAFQFMTSTQSDLCKLDLRGNYIGYMGLKKLVSVWSKFAKEIGKIFDFLPSSDVNTLFGCCKDFYNDFEQSLYKFLGCYEKGLSPFSTLQTLSLCDNYLCEKGLCEQVVLGGEYNALNHLLYLTGLTSLDLSRNNLGDTVLKGLSNTIKKQGRKLKWKSLNLCENQISGQGLLPLINVLKYVPLLESFNLGWNDIGEVGTCALVKGLFSLEDKWDDIIPVGKEFSPCNLLGYYEESATLGDDDVSCLLKKLRTLDLSFNNIKEEGAKALLLLRSKLPTVIINVSGNIIRI